MRSDPLIILTAAEASGDLHAANLARAIRQKMPDARLVAFGGPRLAEAGVELLADLTSQSAMLLGSVSRAPQMIGRLIQFDRYLARHRAALHIAVDSPAANLPFAGRSRARGVPVLGYVAPQLWAWGAWRMAKLRRRVNRLACILPFEPDFFRPHGIAAEFVGHPILEPLAGFKPDAAFIAALPAGSPKIALLPGSRAHEIRRHLPAQLRAAAAIRAKHPAAAFVVAAPPPGHGHSLDIHSMVEMDVTCENASGAAINSSAVALGRLHDVLTWADLVLTVSGSVTLEVAWFARPMVVMYFAPRWQWNLIGRWLIRTPCRSLPNILATRAGAEDGRAAPARGHSIVPELMPWFGSDEPVIAELDSLISSPTRQAAMRSELTDLVKRLTGQPGRTPSERVAEMAAEMIQMPSAK